jgi:membrane-associated phospholipid phosphatase
MRIARLASLLLCIAACAEPTSVPEWSAGPEVAGWPLWLAGAGTEYALPAPPGRASPQGQAELQEILDLQDRRTPQDLALVRQWDGDPVAPWTKLLVDRLEFYWPLLPDVRVATPVRAARIMALLHVAMADAMTAVWRAKYQYRRRPPALEDARVLPLGRLSEVPSYPSEHAAAAAVAAAILAYALPYDDTATYRRLALAAAESRVLAGMAYRTDVIAGWSLGSTVAARALDWAKRDGSDRVWDGELPQGPGLWQPTPPRRVRQPYDPLAGSWRPWVLASGSQFRLPPPPALNSPTFLADLDELRRLGTTRTQSQADLARYWATDAPSTRWELMLQEELQRRGWSAPYAARARAYLSVAMYDAFIACWDAKYTYWLARPVTMDPQIVTVFSTPPFPSYPSGHSTISAAAAVVMGTLFPDRKAHYDAAARQASLSRVWGGVHYRFDVIAGEELGHRVGTFVVQRLQRQ